MDPVTTASLICFAVSFLLSSSAGFTAVYSQDSHPQGRKFGGYRIVPKSCKDLTSNGKHKGICMFNYECTQRNGQVVGSCMDGFLFGACCKLPPGIVYQGIEFPSTTPSTTSHKPTSPLSDPLKPLTFHPIGETILLHKNGSVVKDQNNPQEFDVIKHTQYGTSPPELSTFSYVSGPGGLIPSNGIIPVTKLDETDQWTTKSSQKSTTWSIPTIDNSVHLSNKDTVTPFLLVSTRQEPSLYSTTTAKYNAYSKPYTITTDKNYFTTVNITPEKYNFNHINSLTPQKGSSSTTTKPAYYSTIKISLKPKPIQTLTPATKTPTTISTLHSDDKNMILIPTLNVDDYNKHDSEDATNNASINHILNILNETGPSPEPIATSSPNFSTWVSINNRPEKTNTPIYTTSTQFYHYDNTKAPLPSTTMYQVYGPSFQVTPQVSVTNKPQINTTPEQAPTVIVLGPLNSVSQSKPSRKPINPYSGNTVKPSNTVTVISPPELSTVLLDSSTISVGSTATQSTYWTTISPNYYSNPQVTVNYPSTSGVYYATKPYQVTSKPTQSHIHLPNKPSSEFYSNKPLPTRPSKPVTQTHSASLPISSTTETSPVYLTAKPISLNNPPTKPSTYSHNKPSQGIYITAKPQKTTTNKITYNKVKPSSVQVTIHDQIQNSTEYLIAFPPVRDPNVTLLISQQEKPDQLTPEIYIDEDTHSTPQFVVDESLDNKVHGFVEKIVQSLGGNFVDLENVLLDGQTKENTTQTLYPTKRPNTVPTTSRRPTKKPAKKPATSSSLTKPTVSKPVTYKPIINTSTNRPLPTVLLVSTYRPKPEDVVSITSTYKPSKWPTPQPSLVLFQPTSTSTKRPKTTKTPTVTTVVIDNISVVEEQTGGTSPTTSSTTTKLSEVNFKKECGVRPLMKNGRIVGGKGATFGEWPWQVLVREATWLGLFTKNKCGGVLITNRYVITAAHCQPGFLASLVAVFGEYDISGELESKRSISKNIRRVIVHRQYDAATFENDIALLELDSPVAFDSHIVPICMPVDEEDFTGRMATVTGWGRLKYGGGVPSVLQEVQVPVIENQVCQEMFQTAGHSKTIIGSFLCAGYANGQRDSCEGDSGGPLMVEREDGKWVLAGTVSHGIKCAAPYLPGVYMRTTYYKPWLQTITGVRNL